MGPISCPETTVKNYHYWLCDFPEERRFHRLRGGALKLHTTDNASSTIRNYHHSFVPGQTALILLSADGSNVYIVFTLQLPTHILCYGVNNQGFLFRQGQQIILFSHFPKLALGPTQSPIQWRQRYFSGDKARGAWSRITSIQCRG